LGIEILKPFVYLGSKKIQLKNILKNKNNIIKNKIGSKNIHVEEKKSVLDMGIYVAKNCIKHHKAIPKFLILVSQGQEKKFPSFAEEMAYKCGISNNCLVLTISSGCSGFAQSLYLANQLLSKEMNQGLIVCVEKYSNYIRENDLKTKVLFSDAASATFIKFNKKKNLLQSFHGFDGQNSNSLEVVYKKNKGFLNMDGNKVFLFSIKNIPIIIKKITKKNKDIKFFFVHPGSKILLDTIIEKSGIKSSKAPTSFHITGNTVSTSIPLLIKDNFNRIKKNDKILISGFGVGLSHATLLIRWI
tara:strand:- start:24401 stop:25303 length:903 start_codon:yes stop_codon:yes gene_type:complete